MQPGLDGSKLVKIAGSKQFFIPPELEKYLEDVRKDVAVSVALKLQHSSSEGSYDNHIAQLINHKHMDQEYKEALTKLAPDYDSGMALLAASGDGVRKIGKAHPECSALPWSQQQFILPCIFRSLCMHMTFAQTLSAQSSSVQNISIVRYVQCVTHLGSVRTKTPRGECITCL